MVLIFIFVRLNIGGMLLVKLLAAVIKSYDADM